MSSQAALKLQFTTNVARHLGQFDGTRREVKDLKR